MTFVVYKNKKSNQFDKISDCANEIVFKTNDFPYNSSSCNKRFSHSWEKTEKCDCDSWDTRDPTTTKTTKRSTLCVHCISVLGVRLSSALVVLCLASTTNSHENRNRSRVSYRRCCSQQPRFSASTDFLRATPRVGYP
jgi:hypothetical protein